MCTNVVIFSPPNLDKDYFAAIYWEISNLQALQKHPKQQFCNQKLLFVSKVSFVWKSQNFSFAQILQFFPHQIRKENIS
jgi:hypothetical protein